MKKFKLLSMLMFILTITVVLLTACGSKGYRSIKFFSIDGSVSVEREGKTLNASKNMKLKNSDTVTVSANSSTVLKLDSDKFVMAKENTTLKLEATGKKNNTKTRILVSDGGVIVEVKEKLKDSESFEIASSNSVMAIRGTRIGFDVSKTSESISTNLVTLTGKTEIMLLKDENLNSTNLTECLSLTYESKLNESKDINDMSTLIDNSTVGRISDSDLANVYNTEIREISTYEIDSIVDAVNKFERKLSEYINGTIKITDYPSKVDYGTNPKDLITVDKEYMGLNFYYSKDIDGDYLGYDEDNPLAPGTWYFKAKSLDAYRSDPFEFEVVDKEIKFKNNVEKVDYGTDPSSVIRVDGNLNVNFYYSDTVDGEYRLYNSNDPLDLGKYYYYAECFGHRSKTYEIEVTKIKAEFNFDIVQKSYSGTASLDITIGDKNNVFSDELLSSIEPVNDNTIYKYFISMTYTDSDNNKHSIYFDKDYDNKILDFIFTGENTATFSIEYNLPYYYEVKTPNELTFSFKNSVDIENSVILCREREYDHEIYKTVNITLSNYYALNEESEVKLFLKRVADFTGEVTYEKLDSLYFQLDKDEVLVITTYEFDGVNMDKGYYEFEINFSNSELIKMAQITCNSMFMTYNDNGTMNVYFDIVYTGPSDDVQAFVAIRTISEYVGQTYMTLSKDRRFAVLENVLIDNYHPSNVSAVVKYNGVCYDLRYGDTDYTNIVPLSNYYYGATYYVDADNKTYIDSEFGCFDSNSQITIHADDNDYIVTSDSLNNNKIDSFVIDGVFNNIKIDATVYSFFVYTGNATHTQTFDIEGCEYDFYLTDEIFEEIKKQMLERFGITVKGSNKFIFKGINVKESVND